MVDCSSGTGVVVVIPKILKKYVECCYFVKHKDIYNYNNIYV